MNISLPLCDVLLVPFCGVQYHLGEWESCAFAVCDFNRTSCHVFSELFGIPQDYKELYNLRHSQARNIIERIFGVAKKHFVILRETNEYYMLTQAKVVSACG